MTSKWRKIWPKLRRMRAHEIRTRLSQEFTKRADLAMYRAGVDTVKNSLGTTARKPEFFFSEEEISDRVRLLKTHLPEHADAIVKEADEICDHRFRLLGYEPLDYGQKIDWHLDAVHGKRAPLVPWYNIRFLDYSVVGDHKVTWELNRHQHLVTLAKAWCITHDRRYADEIVAQWYDWQQENPYPLGINWGSSLEVAFRSLSWLWVQFLLQGCPAVPASFERDLLRGLARNGRYIESFLSTYFSPNTHLIGEAAALFFIGTLCPEIRIAPRWRRDGWRILEEESVRQVRPDGVYFEQALHYHVYALDFFLHCRVLAEKNRSTVPAEFDQVVGRMLDVVAAVSQTGLSVSFGDDDGGRLFDPRRNRIDHLTDPLAIGTIFYEREELAQSAHLTEEALWIFGARALSITDTAAPNRTLHSVGFPAGGVYVLADPVEPALMTVDAGPQGTGRCGHGHADALSINFITGHQRWLVDPGTYCYISDGSGRDDFRSTGAHNTVRVDQQNQSLPDGPFAWHTIPRVTAEKWVTGEGFDFFAGSHDGYAGLGGAIHRRFVFHPHGGPWLVRDVVRGGEMHEVETSWHFSEDLKVSAVDSGFIATRQGSTTDDSGLALLWASNVEASGFTETGFVSAAYGAREAAPIVTVRALAPLPVEIATLLQPAKTGSLSKATFRSLSRKGEAVHGYRFSGEATVYSFFFSDKGTPWTFEEWKSDAGFLYCRHVDGRLVQFVMVDGSFVNRMDKPLIQNNTPIERFEWKKQGEVGLAHCSNSTPVAHALDQEAQLDSVS